MPAKNVSLDPNDLTPLKLWQCYDDLFDQKYWYTVDDRIALKGHGLCMDLQDGLLEDDSPIQLYRCTGLNTNQIWVSEPAQ